MDKAQFDRAVAFNTRQAQQNLTTQEHVTMMAMAWQQANGLAVDGMCGSNTRASISEEQSRMLAPPAPPPPPSIGPPGVAFFDRRPNARQAHGPGGQWAVTTRPIASVTGICLHQTAVVLGERIERWDSVGAHFGVTRSGRVIWMHDFDRNVAHGNGWNAGTVGIEIDGLYAGVEGDPSTVWDDPSTAHREQGQVLTQETITATLALCRWIKSEVERASGRTVNALVAHRQSSNSRRADPGEAIWKAVALPLHAELNMSDGGVGFRLGDGRAIPEAWDPRCVGIRY
jgi:hypothetical protein